MTASTEAAASVLARVGAAATAALPLLPAVDPLTAGEPQVVPDSGGLVGQGVLASFSGAAQGQLLVAVSQDLVDALAESPMGALDLTQALQPVAEAAAGTLGAVIVEQGIPVPDLEAGLTALSESGDAAFVLLSDDSGVRALIGLLITSVTSIASGGGGGGAPAPMQHGLDLLHGVEMDVTAELGQTRMTVRDLLSLTPGSVVELDRLAGSPADLLVNGRMIGRGEVVVIDENFGIRVTEIITPDSDRPSGS
ncbi:flagellar motor switch protein FliN [Cryptosporangium arvum]|uniref:Flagellar motor switch protein FliN n=1 Tax=Cryptosporangium arvum DSM 44712 TaxID=927661 RepID=A0A010ZQK7_9ACTN|nr:flagellar motor switch protein FliN [Cryptosporangium arvum]EXG80964.1 flagellar motor switch protein FliN [Cryptosporangium arvum DSM 44712]